MGSCYCCASAAAVKSHYGLMSEDYHTMFAHYYGEVQVLSARPVVYHTIQSHPQVGGDPLAGSIMN